MGIGHGKGIDWLGCGMEVVVGVVHAVVEAIDNTQQQGRVTLQDTLDLRLI